jgi:group I intron endonuclease
MDSFGYIYCVTNKINGRIYLGQKLGRVNSSYLGSGKLITKAVLKYGKENFKLEILAFASSREALDTLEIKYIAEYREIYGNEFLYNLSAGGVGPRIPCTKEKKEKLKKANAEAYKNNPKLLEDKIKWAQERFSIPENNPRYHAVVTKETRIKLSEASSKWKRSPEHLEALHSSLRGKPSHRRGKKFPLETIIKMKESHRLRVLRQKAQKELING